MTLQEVVAALPGLNLCSFKLALRRSSHDFRSYLSDILRRYDEYAGNGLPQKDPISWLLRQDWVRKNLRAQVQLPVYLTEDGGGTSIHELAVLAAAAHLIEPRKVFEIGTFNGWTTSTFIMNAHPDGKVISLDLPPDPQLKGDMIDTDVSRVKWRKLAHFVYELGLQERFQQILCDSLDFDPGPHRDSVELGFVDGAHSYEHVKNDTEKMAVMMSERGLVFWHDYGGKGRFRPLAEYLEGLGRRIEMFRVNSTRLAWTTAAELRKIRG